MAAFRSITAEEEAASALMLALQHLNYPNSDLLRSNNHWHKNAIFPFLQIIGSFLAETLGKEIGRYHLHIHKDDKDEESLLKIAFSIFMTNEEEKWVYPVPPLNLVVCEGSTNQFPTFSKQIERFLDIKKQLKLLDLVKTEANQRNQLLYAGPNGYPSVRELDPAFILERRRRVMVMIQVFLLIAPYRTHQSLVTDALEVMLKSIGWLQDKFEPDSA